jgi:hypothetical protein
MLIDARWQRHLIAALQLEPLFKSEHLDGGAGNGPRAAKWHPKMPPSREREVDDSHHRLLPLLKNLGVGPDVVEASLKRNEATTARAAAIIAEWMTYLPEDCVRAMVSDGWHWST